MATQQKDFQITLPSLESMFADALKTRLDGITVAVRAAHLNVVDGDIAEFGTGPGVSFQIIGAAMNALTHLSLKYRTPVKNLLGFDTFTGFPKATHEADINAPMVKNNTWGEGMGGAISAAELMEKTSKFLPANRIVLYSGFYVDTLPQIPKGTKFSLVHLDCDLYESTFQVLDYLFANGCLSDGCQLLFDDFLENRMSKKMGQRKAWLECVRKHNPDFTDLGFYGQSCWRCVIHVD